MTQLSSANKTQIGMNFKQNLDLSFLHTQKKTKSFYEPFSGVNKIFVKAEQKLNLVKHFNFTFQGTTWDTQRWLGKKTLWKLHVKNKERKQRDFTKTNL